MVLPDYTHSRTNLRIAKNDAPNRLAGPVRAAPCYRARGEGGEPVKEDRRSFLKLFGVSTAAIAAVPTLANAEPTVEVVKAEFPHTQTTIQPTFPQLHYRNDFMDVRDEPLWSQLRIEQNSMQERYQLFQDTLGFDCTLAQTNMLQHGQLPQPETYCIKQIGFVFSPKTIPALRSAFIERYTLQLFLGRKRYWEAPLATVFSIGEPDRDKGFANFPDIGFVTLEIPLVIEAGLYFCLNVSGKPIHPCGKITGWGVFKGLHAVGIQ